jgi:hypothetical protein
VVGAVGAPPWLLKYIIYVVFGTTEDTESTECFCLSLCPLCPLWLVQSSAAPSPSHCDREARPSQPNIVTDGTRVFWDAGGDIGEWWDIAMAVEIYYLCNISPQRTQRTPTSYGVGCLLRLWGVQVAKDAKSR